MHNHSCLNSIFRICYSDTPEPEQSQIRIPSQYKFYGKPKHQCVAIQTLHNFTLKKPFEKHPNKSNELYEQFTKRYQLNQKDLLAFKPYITIPNYKLTIKEDKLKYALPYCVTQYISKRITMFTKNYIVDLFSAPGILSTLLAQQNVEVLQSFVLNLEEKDDVQYNISQFNYYSRQKQEVMIYQLQEFNQIPDVIVLQTLHLNQLLDQQEYLEKFDQLFVSIIQKARNFVIIIPPYVQIDELCAYLSTQIHKNEYIFRNIEFELINICGQRLCSILYIGFIGDEEVQNKLLKQSYLDELLKDQPNNSNINLNKYYQLVDQIYNKIGYLQTMLLIEKINVQQTELDYKINLFYSSVQQLNLIISSNQFDQDQYLIQQTPSLYQPIFTSGIFKKQQSQIRNSNELNLSKSQTFNPNKNKVFSPID